MSDTAGGSPPPLAFGVNVGWMHTGPAGGPAGSPVDAARAAEAAGFDVVTAADHVGRTSPLVALAAAAAVTTRVRLRTYVLDAGFWNPGLLARDVGTLDALSAGRVDLGLGLGHLRHEHEAVGLPFPPYAERVAGFEDFLAELRRHLTGGGLDPAPVQERVPVLVGAMSDRGLDLAARTADVVSLTGLLHVPGQPGGTFALASAARTDAAVARVRRGRDEAGRPHRPLDALLQQVVVDADPEASAAAFAAGAFDVAEVLDSPFLLYARTPDDAAAELVRRAERWGITSWCTHAPSAPALAAVLKAYRS